jgi:hypothetical protein
MAQRRMASRGRAVPGALRPKPFRGDQVAAGVVVLTTLVALLLVRFDGEWAPGVLLGIALAGFAFTGALAVGSPPEGDGPRAYETILHVAAYALALGALVELAAVAGAPRLPASGTALWTGAPLTALAAWFAGARGAATGTLLAAISATVTGLALLDQLFGLGPAGLRWALLAAVLVLAAASLSQRDRRTAHAAQFVNAAGLALLALALTWLVPAARGDEVAGPAWGWQLFVLAGAFGLVAVAAVDRERGPALLGVAALAAFTGLASEGGLVGWPLALAAMAAVMLVIGLRPTTPAPPEPGDDGAAPPPPVPVRPRGEPPV